MYVSKKEVSKQGKAKNSRWQNTEAAAKKFGTLQIM